MIDQCIFWGIDHDVLHIFLSTALLLFPHVHGSEQPPSPTLSEPWRQISWGDNETDLQYVENYSPAKGKVKHLRVLLYGPVGAGKSSFINSVSNVLRRRMSIPAAASSTTSDKSFTKKYETHEIRRGTSNSFYPIIFNDIMGLEEGTGQGVHPEDIKLAMMGRVKEGYKFNSASALSEHDEGYNRSPSLDDRVHVLVCVLSANTAEIKESILEKMKVVREAARDLGIPQMAIITKIDEACAETEKDVRNVYKSMHLKKKMKDFKSAVGIPLNCIFPVKNYNKEIDLNDDVDTLILSALRRMIDFGDDFIKKMDHQYHEEQWRNLIHSCIQWFDILITGLQQFGTLITKLQQFGTLITGLLQFGMLITGLQQFGILMTLLLGFGILIMMRSH
ncbi:interferon-induced protein 44-like isoform X1 [Thunnus maccoyii]|uniref:interferon-induced protein 44-like isoform X1 n=1 Tax=Thunnus maccoyii TaxID=8240 RepID=UPI001C4A85FA|nr:interferon-induced protein 44-like isoform X1 [Thunnus maccoyii]